MEDFEHIPPEEDSKFFCRERLEALSKALEDDLRDSGFKKLMKEMWCEELIKPIRQIMTLDQIIERYGSVITEQELNKLKLIVNNGKK